MFSSTRQVLTSFLLKENILTKNILKNVKSNLMSKNVHSASILLKDVRRGNQKVAIKEYVKDEGNLGENTINIDDLTMQ